MQTRLKEIRKKLTAKTDNSLSLVQQFETECSLIDDDIPFLLAALQACHSWIK